MQSNNQHYGYSELDQSGHPILDVSPGHPIIDVSSGHPLTDLSSGPLTELSSGHLLVDLTSGHSLMDLSGTGYQPLGNYTDQSHHHDNEGHVYTQYDSANYYNGLDNYNGLDTEMTEPNNHWGTQNIFQLAGFSGHISDELTQPQTPIQTIPTLYNSSTPICNEQFPQQPAPTHLTNNIPPTLTQTNSAQQTTQKPSLNPEAIGSQVNLTQTTQATTTEAPPAKSKPRQKSTKAPVLPVNIESINSQASLNLGSPTSATHTPSGPKSQPRKKDTTLSDELMETFKDHTLHELRKLQKTHVKYTRMNEEMKCAAQDVYFEYQRQLHLLSIKHQRSFKALAKYLGQRRTRQKKSAWHKFQSSGKTAQKEYHQTQNSIGQRNKDASKIYRELDPASRDLYNKTDDDDWVDADSTEDPNADDRSQFDVRRQSTKKLLANVDIWAKGVQLKLKELSDGLGLEGFLVIADQDHRQPYFFQGGSLLGDVFLRGLIDEGDAICRFAVWTAGTKIRTKPASKITTPVVSAVCNAAKSNDTSKTPDINNYHPPEEPDINSPEKNRDVCQGGLAQNHHYLSCQPLCY
ncbi:hypothetical protein PGTUg99_024666 [Puccinia graminis f. sp. tritici]|uniref:Uncharacterized protein n=1 Tax=Puccinia graminis f. sp. tritici TaxID=56615 RepID=A0A5B0RAC1_PUCGR|nr:hypothetical protein PGTUg99_024666 [Puccinia graminis f. sp. tritici]